MLEEQAKDDALYGCIFCRTGYEKALVQELSQNLADAEFLVGQKKSRRRISGKMIEETVIMFPGYVFLRTCKEIDTAKLKEWPNVLKLLSNSDGDWQLTGDDLKFAEWLFSQGGVIGFSDALVVGEKLKIRRGPLMGYEGQIIKVNRRFQNCLVVMKFEHREFKVWLGYDLIS